METRLETSEDLTLVHGVKWVQKWMYIYSNYQMATRITSSIPTREEMCWVTGRSVGLKNNTPLKLTKYPDKFHSIGLSHICILTPGKKTMTLNESSPWQNNLLGLCKFVASTNGLQGLGEGRKICVHNWRVVPVKVMQFGTSMWPVGLVPMTRS